MCTSINGIVVSIELEGGDWALCLWLFLLLSLDKSAVPCGKVQLVISIIEVVKRKDERSYSWWQVEKRAYIFLN